MFFYWKQMCHIHSNKRDVKYPAQTIYKIEGIVKFFSAKKKLFDYTVLLSQGQAVASN